MEHVMRAMVLENIGVSLKLVDRPDPMAGPGETLAFSTVRAFPKMLAGRLKNSHHGRQAGRHVVHILRRAVWSLEIVDSISDTKSSTRSELA